MPLPKNNREFNFGQPANMPAVSRVFDQAEIGLPFRCDVHGWMNAYVNVVPHPFFAVTKDDGSFEIKGLPAGSYTLELWHERLGTQTLPVTVDGRRRRRSALHSSRRARPRRIIPQSLPGHRKGVAMEDCETPWCWDLDAHRGRLRRRGNAAGGVVDSGNGRGTVFFVTPNNGATIKPMSTIEFGSSGVTVAAVPPGELKPEQVRPGRFTTTSASTPTAWRPAPRSRRPTRGSTSATARSVIEHVAGTGGASSHRAGGR